MEVFEVCGIQMTLEDAEKFTRWLEQPEGKLLIKFLEDQRDRFDERCEGAIGNNAITDILNRERNLASKLAMKSVLLLHQDVCDFIINEKSRQKNS